MCVYVRVRYTVAVRKTNEESENEAMQMQSTHYGCLCLPLHPTADL